MSNKVSPIVAIAAGSVIVFSAVGVGVMTGLIPSSLSNTGQRTEPPSAAVAAAPSPTTLSPTTPSPSAPSPAARPAVPAPQASRPAKAEQAPARVERTQVAAARSCASCGTVESVKVVEHAGDGSGLGAIGGAVVGGVLGNQIGDGSGRRVATVAGAAGGAYAGHQIEKHVKTKKSWNVLVRMEDGSSRTFPYGTDPGFRAGDQVNVVEGRLARR